MPKKIKLKKVTPQTTRQQTVEVQMAATRISGARIRSATIPVAALILSGTYAFTGTVTVGGVAVATLSDLNAAIEGLDPKPSVDAATTAALAANTYAAGKITADANGAFPTIDTVAAASDGTPGSDDGTQAGSNLYLVKDEVSKLKNGLYYLSDPGDATHPWVLTRIAEMSATSEAGKGSRSYIKGGSTNGGKAYVVTVAPAALGTNDMEWSLYSDATVYTASNGVTKSGADFQIDLSDTNPSLEVSDGGLRAKVDDSTIERSASGLQVKDAGITSAKLSATLAARVGGRYDDVGTWDSTGETTFDGVAGNMLGGAGITDLDVTEGGHIVSIDGVIQKLGAGYDYTISASGGAGGVFQITFNEATPNPSTVQIRCRRTGVVA